MNLINYWIELVMMMKHQCDDASTSMSQ